MSSRFSILFACGAAATGGAACTTMDNDGSAPGSDQAGSTVDNGQSTTDGAVATTVASTLPECKAQRAVYIVASNGALSWFTLVWPAPEVISNFQPAYAYDDPTKAKDVSTTPDHPLFARKIGTRATWTGKGTSPQPTAFIAGFNETHTNTPQSFFNSPAAGNLVGQAAAIQSTLPSVIPVLAIGTAGPYTAAPGAPVAVSVADYNAAIAAFTGKITAAQQAALKPTADQVSRYVPAGATAAEADFGNTLAFAANAFKAGLVNTIMLPAYKDDPHGAFTSGIAGAHADHTAAALDAFYTDLAAANEPSCSHAAKTITLADNVATIVDGDTPKSSFSQAGWPDGTIGNSNFLYLRSNGFTTPGWFGNVTASLRTNFNPATGLLDASAVAADDTAASYAGVLYAIARGDKTRVGTVTAAQFDGVIAR